MILRQTVFRIFRILRKLVFPIFSFSENCKIQISAKLCLSEMTEKSETKLNAEISKNANLIGDTSKECTRCRKRKEMPSQIHSTQTECWACQCPVGAKPPTIEGAGTYPKYQ